MPLLIMSILIYYCSTGESYLFGRRKPSDDDLSLFFKKNQSELKRVIPLCRDHPALRWIGKKEGEISFNSSPVATVSDYGAAKAIRTILDPLGVGSVDCSRRFDVPGDTFLGVNFTMYARGLSVSGESKSIRYSLPSTDRAYWEGHKAMLQSGELKPLPEPNWYIYTSQ